GLLTATVAPPSLRGVPLSPFSPLLPLLLLSTSLALRRSALRLPLVGDAALARAREERVVEEVVEEAVEEVEVAVGVVPGVGASVAAVEAVEAVAEAVEAAAAVVEAVEEVVLVAVQPRSVEALVAASVSSSCAPVRPRLFSSFVSGTLGVGGLEVQIPARTFFTPALIFPDAVELPRWHDLLLQNGPIFDLDFDAFLAAMYALADITEGDCYLRVPPDPGTVAAALVASVFAAPGAGTSPLSGTAPTESLHTFTLDSGASRSFFRDSTMLTPLRRPVAVSLADPSGGPVLAHSSTVLPCPAAPSGLLSGLHLPSFSTNLVSGPDLQDAWVDQFTPGGQRVTHCTCSRTGRHLATFTRRPGSSLYTLTTAPPPVSASGQVAASSQVFSAASRSRPASAPCSCRPLAHETLLWHHRLGHPSLPRLRGMASRALVSGLPMSLPPFPPGPAPTCVPYVEGRQRAAPHSSSFPPIEAPLQTLHMDVWGPARVRGQGHERYFLLVVDDYSCYTTVFPLRSKGEVTERREFSSDLLRAFCRLEGIRKTFTLPASPQQNGIAERRIGMVMDVARTSMIHAAAPHFLWPFAVQYAAHQINLQPRVSLPETTPTLRWTGKVGDASAFRVWGSRAFGPAPSGVSQVDPAEPVEVAVDSGATMSAETRDSQMRLLCWQTARSATLADYSAAALASRSSAALADFALARPGAKKSDVLREFAHWLVVVERQAKKSVMVLHSDRGGEFLEKQFTDFVDSKGIVHDLTCPYTPRQNGMVETEMRTVVESVQTMLLHLGVQHHWWGLHLSVPEESKGWEILDITDNQVVTTSDVVFYETMSLEVWASEHGSTSGRTQVNPPTDTSIAMLPLGKLADEDAGVVRPPSPSTCPPRPTPCSRPASADIAPTKEQSAAGQSAGKLTTGTPTMVQQDAEGSEAGDNGGEQSGAKESTDSYVAEDFSGPRHSGRERRQPDFLSYHACLPPAAYTTT
ncbi:unnamed protein product, partial [Closterium sp. NIES-54]